MIITKLAKNFIKLQAGEVVVAVNPPGKSSKEKSSKFGADIALVSLKHEDWNGAEDMQFGEKKPFIVDGPGEYEIKNIFIKAFASKSAYKNKSEEELINTVFSINMDNLSMCFLGANAGDSLSEEATESIDEIDILFISASKNTVEGAKAYKLAVTLEPKIIIPLGDEEEIKVFIKESGAEKPEKLDKLTLKKKDLDGKQGEIVLLV